MYIFILIAHEADNLPKDGLQGIDLSTIAGGIIRDRSYTLGIDLVWSQQVALRYMLLEDTALFVIHLVITGFLNPSLTTFGLNLGIDPKYIF